MPAATAELASIRDRRSAAALLKPLRLEVLARAREPRSATEIAAELGLPRQKVNYHVRELERAGLLRLAESRRRRNLTERRYQATARAYLLSPELLGELGADERRVEDRLSAAYLLALGARMQRELGRATAEASEEGKRIATLSIDAELRFESPEQREAFANALRDAVTRVVAEHASPAVGPDGAPGAGRPFRLVAGCYPVPPESVKPDEEEEPRG
jgi:DNA-binding transcriptional ArsR family regulator